MATTEVRGELQAPARAVARSAEQRRKKPIAAGTVIRHVILWIFVAIILLPLLWVAVLSIKSLPDAYQGYLWPRRFDFTHYAFVLQHIETIPDNFKNSFVATGGTIFTTVICAVLGGFALVHTRMWGKAIVFSFLVASLFFPTRITALIAIFQLQKSLGLLNVNPGLILPYTTLSLALCIFIMKGIFEGISSEIADAARIDGAGAFRTMWSVMLPLARNGIVVVVMVVFVTAWGEFLLERTLISEVKVFTMPQILGTAFGGMGAWAWPRIAAVYIMSILPGIVIFAVVQKWYMAGLTEGALKG
jgi:ABC-type glycerol-3-phosphate transport system permease component